MGACPPHPLFSARAFLAQAAEADPKGLGPVPALAGRSPSYMARQLYDLQQGNRDGAWSDLMDRAVMNLTVADIVDIVAYTASLDP